MTRGKATKTRAIIGAALRYLEENNPATVRGCCYKLFTRGLIPDMNKPSTNSVGRILKEAREDGEVPWEWIVDETREAETISSWSNLREYGRAVLRSYRKDRWQTQPCHLEVWSEKGTVRGVIAPVLDEFAVTLRVFHGFNSATAVHDIAEQSWALDKPYIALYVGDWDPSGLFMSDVDLPARLDRYEARRMFIQRIALDEPDLAGLPSFPAADKRGDPRYEWFVENNGDECWELDALEPRILRQRLHDEIRSRIDRGAWDHAGIVEEAERESIEKISW